MLDGATQPTTPLIFRGPLTIDDFAQGYVGNCWFWSAVQALIATDESRLRKLFGERRGPYALRATKLPGNGVGTHVWLHIDGTFRSTWARLDKLPKNRCRLNRQDPRWWPALLEAGASKIWGDSWYAPVKIHLARWAVNTFTQYGEIGRYTNLNVGYATTAFTALTGQPASSMPLDDWEDSLGHIYRCNGCQRLRAKGGKSFVSHLEQTNTRDHVRVATLRTLGHMLRYLYLHGVPMAALKYLGGGNYHYTTVYRVDGRGDERTTVVICDPARPIGHKLTTLTVETFLKRYLQLDFVASPATDAAASYWRVAQDRLSHQCDRHTLIRHKRLF